MGSFAKKLRNKQKKHDRKNMEATYRTVDKAIWWHMLTAAKWLWTWLVPTRI